MNKGQINHVFSFILITVVISATIFLSIKLTGALLTNTCDAEFVSVQRTIDEIARTYDTIGTKQNLEVLSACNAEFLCIFSQDWDGTTGLSALNVSSSAQSQLALAATIPRPKNNVFLVTGSEPIKEVSSQTKFITDGVLCLRAGGGRFYVHTEGHGRTVEISRPQ
jgi:hypothetical protein